MNQKITNHVQGPADKDGLSLLSLEALLYINQLALAQVFGIQKIKEIGDEINYCYD